MRGEEEISQPLSRLRLGLVIGCFAVGAAALLARAVDLHVIDRDFLRGQGDARHLRVVSIPAHRGMIVDRHGEPLAISTPVHSVWANPQLFLESRKHLPELANLLGIKPAQLKQFLEQRRDREFVYLQRHISPDAAAQVMALEIPGVALQKEYRRYYPTGEVAAHVLGYTDVDDSGLEGLELVYDNWLRGEPGSKRVIKDRLGRIVEDVESISEPQPGRDLRLSIDRRLQYLAYRELKAAVLRHHASAGSLVLLDTVTGEVLAMVNQPAYNPNNLEHRGGSRARNRAVTDLFEPGSSVKPFTVAAGLESGRFTPDSSLDTSPGFLQIGPNTVHDHHNLGRISLTTLLQKSSNVGASMVALALPADAIWQVLHRVGFGATTGCGFPGEVAGMLPQRERWREIERASLSYGYGLSVTPLQLAQAYSVLAGDGRLRPTTLLSVSGELPEGKKVLSPVTVLAVRKMMESVVSDGGTGTLARVAGYRVAGKTGTARKLGAEGYSTDRYVAVFAGMAPATRPRLAMVVVIDDPAGGVYYGGDVAAPVFGKVMAGALRILDIPPDDLPSLGQLAQAGATTGGYL